MSSHPTSRHAWVWNSWTESHRFQRAQVIPGALYDNTIDLTLDPPPCPIPSTVADRTPQQWIIDARTLRRIPVSLQTIKKRNIKYRIRAEANPSHRYNNTLLPVGSQRQQRDQKHPRAMCFGVKDDPLQRCYCRRSVFFAASRPLQALIYYF